MKELSVAAIQKGSVIDHIKPGEALRLVSLLRLRERGYPITLGLNLPSASYGLKDLIKMEEKWITKEEAKVIALFSKEAKVNLIENYQVVEKFGVECPTKVEGIFVCSNAFCITHKERIPSKFDVRNGHLFPELCCRYCTKKVEHHAV